MRLSDTPCRRRRYPDGVMRNAPAARRALTVAAALLLGISYGPASSAQTHDPQLGICANGDAQSRVSACSQLLARTGLDRATTIAAYINRGNAHDAADQFDLALKDYQSALDLDSNNWTALRSRAGSYYRRGQLAAAVKDLVVTHDVVFAKLGSEVIDDRVGVHLAGHRAGTERDVQRRRQP